MCLCIFIFSLTTVAVVPDVELLVPVVVLLEAVVLVTVAPEPAVADFDCEHSNSSPLIV